MSLLTANTLGVGNNSSPGRFGMAAFRVAEVILGAGAGLGVAQAVLAQVELPELDRKSVV